MKQSGRPISQKSTAIVLPKQHKVRLIFAFAKLPSTTREKS